MQPTTRTRTRLANPAAALAVALALVVSLPVLPFAAAAQERGAVVHGASKVFVRRGPGMSFPPFARLAEGSVVQVKGQQGQWVRIKTTGGQMGFVHGKYLLMLDREAVPVAPPPEEETADPPAAVVPQPAAATESPEATPPQAEDEPEPRFADAAAPPVADDANDTAAITAPTTATSTEPGSNDRLTMAEERAAIADEVRRLTDAVAALQRRIEENEPIDNGFGETGADEAGSVSGGAVLLGLLGVAVGWFLGGRYGRAQERGRRSRIRF